MLLPEREFVECQVKEWLEEDIVEPNNAEYSSPIVVTKKKDGSFRLCIDYRRINSIIVKDRYSLPLIEDVLDSWINYKMANCSVYWI